MRPDDPRHGTAAGATAHHREGSDVCEPCATAKVRADKRRRVYGSNLVPLPDHIWRIVHGTDIRLLSRTTGVSECAIKNMRKKHGQLNIYRHTLERLEQFNPVTDIGVQRRAQALAALGWSSTQIAAHAGIHHEYVRNTQNQTQKHYLHQATRDGIVAAFEALHMSTPPPNRWVSRVRSVALAKGWVPPLAWDDIDDPAARPQGQLKEAS